MGYLRGAVLIALLLQGASVQAQNQALLIDRSGSMRVYYDRGIVDNLSRRILSALETQGHTQIVTFGAEVQSISDLNAVSTVQFGSFTYLDKALEYAISKRSAIAWMITDNIQDQPGASEAGNTEIFYKVLRGSGVKKVVIFPMPQSQTAPGIAVYAILLSAHADGQFEAGIDAFMNKVRSEGVQTEPFRIKPLDKDTISIAMVKSSIQTKGGQSYQEGQIIHETFELRFKSKFDHLVIKNGNIEVPKIQADFGPNAVLKPDKIELGIKPTVVKSLNPKGETGELYTVTADLGTVRMKKDIASIWRAALGKSKESHVLKLAFLIKVPQESFELRDKFLEIYNADTLQEAKTTGKIYGIRTLPSLLTEDMTQIVVEMQVPVTIKYPWWPGILLVLAFLTSAVIVVVVGRWGVNNAYTLFTRNRWKVRAKSGNGVDAQCTITEVGTIIVNSTTIGEVNGNKFHPAGEVIILGSEDKGYKVDLENGTQIKLKIKQGETYVLVFESVQSDQKNEGSYTPRRR